MAKKFCDIISSSLIEYLGYGRLTYPREDMCRALIGVEEDLKKNIADEIEKIMTDANQMQPDWENHDLFSGCKWISEKIGDKYKSLNDEALKAISWAYSFWWK